MVFSMLNIIRRLENALLHVASHAVLTGEKLTPEVLEGLLWEIPDESPAPWRIKP